MDDISPSIPEQMRQNNHSHFRNITMAQYDKNSNGWHFRFYDDYMTGKRYIFSIA